MIRTAPEQVELAGPSRASRGEGVGSILRSATVLYGSIGCLGVALFALTITSMLTGKASLAHLMVGLLGVALMTVAGIYFLLRRGHTAGSIDPAENASAEADDRRTL